MTDIRKTSPEDDSEESTRSYEDSWVTQFLADKKNQSLLRVHENFLSDRFNLHGLREKIEGFEEAYLAIQDKRASTNYEVESTVYLLIHQRYLLTKIGLEGVLERVLSWDFGECSRVGCKNSPYMPVGLSNEPHKSGTKVYCYNCASMYEPTRSDLKKLDGCAWGTSFPHLLLLTYPYHFEKTISDPFVPRVYGFQVADPDEFDSA